MKKVLLLVAVALAFTLTAVAQETGTQTTTSQTTTTTKTKKSKGEAKGAKEASLTGCLAAGTEPNTYTLTKGKKNVTVTGMDLSQHVGHEVKLTGDWEKAAAEKPAAGESAAAGGKKAGKEFKATNVEHISDTCSASQSATKTKTKSKSKTKSETTTPPGF